MLRRIIDEKWLTAKAVVGLFPAHSIEGDSIELYFDEKDKEVLTTLHFLRQQAQYAAGKPNLSLADLVAPTGNELTDYIGLLVYRSEEKKLSSEHMELLLMMV